MKFIKKHLDKIIIVVFVIILYGNTIPNNYSIDDKFINSNNSHISKGIQGIPEILTSYYDETYHYHYGYRPVTQILYAIEYSIFSDNPHVSHLINILLYCLIMLLLYRLLREKIFASYNRNLSYIIVLLFIAHPIHTEVVASLKNREELLSFLFGILSLYLFIRYTEEKKIVYLIIGFLSFIIGNLTKESIVVFGALIPLVLYYFSDTRLLKVLMIFFVFVIITYSIKVIKTHIFHSEVDLLYFENPLQFNKGLSTRIGTSFICVLYYLRLLIYPGPLSFYYGYKMVPVVEATNFIALASLIVHIGLLVYAIHYIKKKTVLSFAVLFYLLSVAFISNIFFKINGLIGERLAFTASLGFVMIVGILLWNLQKLNVKKSWLYGIISVILILYSVKTISRNRDWNTEMSLYAADINHLENSAKANGLYATRLLFELIENPNAENKKTQIELALKHFKRSVEISPDYYSSYTNMGYIYLMFYNDIEKALKYFNQSIKHKKENATAFFYKGLCYEKEGNFDNAVKFYSQALSIDSNDLQSLSKMANWNYKQGNYHRSIKLNGKIMKIKPDLDIPYINVGNYFFMAQDTLNALKYWEIAYEKNTDNYYILLNLVNLYRTKGIYNKYKFYYNKLQKFENN